MISPSTAGSLGLMAALLACVLPSGCTASARGARPEAEHPGAVATTGVLDALPCRGQSLEYSVGSFVLEPRRRVHLSCDEGRPTATFEGAWPPEAPEPDRGNEEELEMEEGGEVSVLLEVDEWQRLWASLEAAGARSVSDCRDVDPTDGVTHRIELWDGEAEVRAMCVGLRLPEHWARVVRVLDQLEQDHAVSPDTEPFWPFDSEYWRDELRYHGS